MPAARPGGMEAAWARGPARHTSSERRRASDAFSIPPHFEPFKNPGAAPSLAPSPLMAMGPLLSRTGAAPLFLMLLKQIVQQLPDAKVEGPLDRDVSGIAYDSRRVTPGMLFVAIPGRNADGHEFISTAIERGASAVICERTRAFPSRATRISVPDAREALACAATSYYEHPSSKLKVIGVTGTNGKTTVAFMVKAMLESAGLKAGLIGTVRYEIGDRAIPAQRTTPESLEVQQMMAQMLKADCEACVMEVSSHALEQKRVLGVEFDVGIFTNLTRDHLDYHGTMENYFAEKKKLFASMQGNGKKGGAVVKLDDRY